ncbi:hypothetical protein TNCV_3048561 [Trichonephila clavipes]|nr:hypothetical protein TNCV_3048561 [Trichonephila clavipes]
MVSTPLVARHHTTRRNWAAEHRYWMQSEWSQVLFTEESRFSLKCDAIHVLTSNLTTQRYLDEILTPHVVLYAAVIGDSFHSMQDNSRSHTACLVEKLKQHSVWGNQYGLLI